jgi:transcription antitermination protein NusB
MSRKTAREAAMKLIYEYGITGILSLNSMIEMPDILKVDKLSEENLEYVNSIVEHYMDSAEEIDQTIEKYSISWNISRISKVDLAILRLAFYEMMKTDTPHEILVNEAVDLAKKYSGEKSPSFINGLLGGYLKEKET